MRELKKIKVSRISIVTSGANRERFMIRKSVDFDKEDIDIADLFPLLAPAHLIEKWERNEEEREIEKAEYEAKKTSPDDLFPSIPIIGPADLIEKMVDDLDEEDDDDDDE